MCIRDSLSSCWGRWDRLAGASDVAPRRFSRSPARRAKDSSPVRQHWENDGPASAPGLGGTTGQPVPLFRPVPGLANAACLLPTAMRRGLLSVALRALRTIPFAACRYVGQVVNLMPLVFPLSAMLRKLWGRPPGLRGTPSSRIWNKWGQRLAGCEQADGGVGRGPGGPPHDLCRRPAPEKRVALG